jgi:hypothetical protein
VRRDRTSYSGQSCRRSQDGWGATGWCFVADDITELTSGRTITLTLSLCRNASSAGQVRFPNRQQAAWTLQNQQGRLWTSNEQPSPFAAGEAIVLQPQQCLRWRTDWRVTSHGQPIAAGDYSLVWSSGANLRDPIGNGYHEFVFVNVGPGSSHSVT